MELRQLYYVLEVAKQESFSKAADALFITQSNISQQIHALEKEIDTKLFMRDTHNVTLTESGEKFCRLAEHVATAFDELQANFAEGGVKKKSCLNIATFNFFDKIQGLSEPIAQFYNLHKNIIFSIETMDAYDAYDRIEEKNIDFAVIKLFGNEKMSNKFHYIPLRTEPLYALLSPRNKLAGKPSVTLEELCEFPMLTRNRNSFLYKGMEKLFADAGLPFNVSIMTDNVSVIRDYIINYDCISLGSASTADYLRSEGLSGVPLSPTIESNFYLIYLKKRTLTGIDREFLSYTIKMFQDNEKTT